MLNWPRIRCALFGHGRIGGYIEPDLKLAFCERCGQITRVSNGTIEYIDKLHFLKPTPQWAETRQSGPELEGVWQEWGET